LDYAVWGGDGGIYSPLSFLCMAGLHATSKNGGYFKVKILGGEGTYKGAAANDVRAAAAGAGKRSFSIEAINDQKDQIDMASDQELETPVVQD
jgi:hypothetical protein